MNSPNSHKIRNLSDPYLWLTLLLTVPVIGPLLQPGYYWGAHDARHSVYFLHQFNKAVQDGVWYPRWAPDFAFGHGYPFFNIYGPLSSYSGQALLFLGFDIVTAVKIVFGLSAFLSGLAMYLFVRRLLGPPAGLIAALTYVYFPYHIFDLYVRAALAESVGFIFVPLVLWGFYEVVTRPRLPAVLWAALAYAGLMFTSNLLALMFTPILGIYVAMMILWGLFEQPSPPPSVRGRTSHQMVETGSDSTPSQPPSFGKLRTQPGRGRSQNLPPSGGERGGERISQPHLSALKGSFASNRWLAAFLSGFPPLFTLLLGLGLSSIFFVPMVAEYNFVRVDQWVGGRFAFGDDFVEVFQLFSPKWGFGASIPGPDDEAGFQLGLAAIVLFLFSFLTVPRLENSSLRRTLYFFQVITVILIFLTTPLSTLVWQYLPLSSLAQFPWRLLVIIAPFMSILAGTILIDPTQKRTSHTSISQSPNLPISQPPHLPIPNLRPHSLLPTIILSSLIILASYPYIRAEVRDPKPTEGPVSQAALFRFQQSADEMTGQTAWVQRIPNWSSLAEQVERGGDITTKVNYSALPGDDSVGVFSMEMSSVHELLWVGTNQEGQAVTFLIPYYPGWTAYIYEDLGPHDGNLDKSVGPVTRIGPVVDRPQIRTTPIEGWMVVPIPPGSHFLELRFEDTFPRILGRWLSLASLLLWGGLFILSRKLTNGGQRRDI